MEILKGTNSSTRIPVFTYPGFPNYFSCPRGLGAGEGYVNVRKKDLQHILPSGGTPVSHRLRLAHALAGNAEVNVVELKKVYAVSSSFLPICDGDPSGPDTLYRVKLVDFRYFLSSEYRGFLGGEGGGDVDNVFSTTEFQEVLQLPYWDSGEVEKYTESTWIGEWSDTWLEDILRNTVVANSTYGPATVDYSMPPAEGDLPGNPTTSPINIIIRSLTDLQNLFLMLGIDMVYNPLNDSLSFVRLHHPDNDDTLTSYIEDTQYVKHLDTRVTPDQFTPVVTPRYLHIRFQSFYEKRTKYERLSPFHTVVVDLVDLHAELVGKVFSNNRQTIYDFTLAEFPGDVDDSSVPDNPATLTARAEEIAEQFYENIFPVSVYGYHKYHNMVPNACITEVMWKEQETIEDRALYCGTQLIVSPPRFGLTRPFPPAKAPGELTQTDLDDLLGGIGTADCECYEHCADWADLTIELENYSVGNGGPAMASRMYRFTINLQGNPVWAFASGTHTLIYNEDESSPPTSYIWRSPLFLGPCPSVPASEPDTYYFWELIITGAEGVELALRYDTDNNPETTADCWNGHVAASAWEGMRFYKPGWFDPGCGNLFELLPTYLLRSQAYYYNGGYAQSCQVCVYPLSEDPTGWVDHGIVCGGCEMDLPRFIRVSGLSYSEAALGGGRDLTGSDMCQIMTPTVVADYWGLGQGNIILHKPCSTSSGWRGDPDPPLDSDTGCSWGWPNYFSLPAVLCSDGAFFVSPANFESVDNGSWASICYSSVQFTLEVHCNGSEFYFDLTVNWSNIPDTTCSSYSVATSVYESDPVAYTGAESVLTALDAGITMNLVSDDTSSNADAPCINAVASITIQSY